MTKGINSRQKGCRGEREWRDIVRANGFEARRGQQFSGSPDSPDVVSELPFHMEVKRVERLNIDNAMKQAEQDCGEKMPMVAHKKNHGKWLVTIPEWVYFKLIAMEPIKKADEKR